MLTGKEWFQISSLDIVSTQQTTQNASQEMSPTWKCHLRLLSPLLACSSLAQAQLHLPLSHLPAEHSINNELLLSLKMQQGQG